MWEREPEWGDERAGGLLAYWPAEAVARACLSLATSQGAFGLTLAERGGAGVRVVFFLSFFIKGSLIKKFKQI